MAPFFNRMFICTYFILTKFFLHTHIHTNVNAEDHSLLHFFYRIFHFTYFILIEFFSHTHICTNLLNNFQIFKLQM